MLKRFGTAIAVAVIVAAPVIAQPTSAQEQGQAAYEFAQARSADDVIMQLRQAGFTVSSVARTFLGRIRITASDATTIREIVVSRSTGEILSDRVQTRSATERSSNGGGASETGVAASGGVAGGNTNRSAETGAQASGGISGGGGVDGGSASTGFDASGGVGGGESRGGNGGGLR